MGSEGVGWYSCLTLSLSFYILIVIYIFSSWSHTKCSIFYIKYICSKENELLKKDKKSKKKYIKKYTCDANHSLHFGELLFTALH